MLLGFYEYLVQQSVCYLYYQASTIQRRLDNKILLTQVSLDYKPMYLVVLMSLSLDTLYEYILVVMFYTIVKWVI